MKKKLLMYFRLMDAGGCILYEGLPASFPFPEEVILQRCLLYFNDPEPCYIHRGAVVLRLAAELTQAMEKGPLKIGHGAWADCFAAFPGADRAEGFYP